jgi:hypothetical protein
MKNNDPHTDPKAVAERAYQLFLARGGEHGHDFEDWVRAEQELHKGKPQLRTTQPVVNGRAKR